MSSTDWALRRIRDHLEHRPLKEEGAFGRGAASLLAEGDVVRLAAGPEGRERLDALLAEEATREEAGREVAG